MQGFNMGRYVPPDLEGTISGNALQSKHALGARASKLRSHGILTVRFEMPFAVWCLHCEQSSVKKQPTIIGQGVRFNAEKKKVGAYYSTPIWSFRFKHTACGGWIEMRTDPQNTAYVVTEGGKKRDTGEDKAADGEEQGPGGVILTEAEREALRSNAFAKLEKTIDDREQLKRASARIEDLTDLSDRQWKDTYALNQKLRREFRVGRKMREKEALDTESLKDRMGLGIDLVPGTEEDAMRAKLVDFGAQQRKPPAAAGLGEGDDDGEYDDRQTLTRPLFDTAKGKPPPPGRQPGENLDKAGKKMLKTEKAASHRRDKLASTVLSNTRAVTDPFLQTTSVTRQTSTGSRGKSSGFHGLSVKRKRSLHHRREDTTECQGDGHAAQPGEHKAGEKERGSKLVEYDSD